MDEKKIVINNIVFREDIKRNGCDCIPLYNVCSKFMLRFGNLTKRCESLGSFNVSPMMKNLKGDTLIVFDGGVRINVLSWISKIYPQKRLIFYYWNPVASSISPHDVPDNFEKWSYSPSDCERFGLRYNSTFFFPEKVSFDNAPIERDVFFIGINKNRLEKIRNYEWIFANLGLKTEFLVVKNKKNRLAYAEVLDKDSHSRCILDYYTNQQAGLSLRAMEALFLEKKLITNNESIMNYDFYNPNNIFILGQRNINDLKKFVYEPYLKISEEIKQRYSFKCWLDRF